MAMRARALFCGFLVMAAVSVARGQLGTTGDGGGGGSSQLAQFQPGISPLGRSLDLSPGQPVRLALNCLDLFAATPTNRVAFTAPSGDGAVTQADGRELTLAQALEAGVLNVRGRGPADPARRERGEWYDVYVTNLADQPVHLSLPAGTLLVPAGQQVPDVRSGVRRLLAAAGAHGLLGSDTVAHAVWATRGFTREDVEETTMAPLSDTAARQVQVLLAAADLGYQFDRGPGEYTRLYEQKRSGLGDEAASVRGTALLPDGRTADAQVRMAPDGRAVVALTPDKGRSSLYYAGQVLSRHEERLQLALSHLKTGGPLEVAQGPITIRAATEQAHR
jgi:hypothetical protein